MSHPLPRRMVAILLTDLEKSTRLWESEPQKMREVMVRHDDLVRRTAEDHRGRVPRARGEGDSALIVFETASDAAEAAAAFVLGVKALGEAVGLHLAVRCAVHVGDVFDREEDLYGSAMNRCARLRGVAHGGQVLLTEVAYQLCSGRLPAGYGFKGLGRVRLRDLLEPEAAFQLIHPDLESDFPVPASLDRAPNNLPIQSTPFIGRLAELPAVAELIRTHNLVTVLGPGGIGKTRLAVQTAAELLDEFPDGVWFINLAPVEREQEVLATVLRVLRMEASLDVALFTAELQEDACLLVIDNCEQVLEAVSSLAKQLLGGAPRVRLMLTSRHALGLSGERVFPLAGLSVPDKGDCDIEQLMEAEAVQLILDRARQHDPAFQATLENSAALQGIVRRLDGLPLAIELAAARLRIMRPAQLLQRLTDIFSGLGVGPTDALPRHRTIDASIEWSYSLLDEDERVFFLALSQFADGWAIEASETIHSELGLKTGALALLTSLTDKSMIVAGSGAAGRMRILVPLREFAVRRIDDAPQVSRAYLNWARTASDEAVSAVDRGLGLAQLEAENLRSALEMALARGEFDEAFSICTVMNHLWYTSGQFVTGQTYAEATLKLAVDEDRDRSAVLLDMIGVFAWARGELGVAESSIRKAESLWTGVGDERSVAQAQGHLGFVFYRRGQLAEAEAQLSSAYGKFKAHGNEIEIARAATNLGNFYHSEGRTSESIPYFEEALELARDNRDLRSIRTLSQLLAESALRDGRIADAHSLVCECLRLAVELKDVIGAADAMLGACEVFGRVGDFESAARALGSLNVILKASGQALDQQPAKWRESLLAGLGEQLPEARLKRLLRGGGGDPIAAIQSVLGELGRQTSDCPSNTLHSKFD